MKLTAKRLRKLLRYNPSTGLFLWVRSPRTRTPVGEVAGSLNAQGYYCIGIRHVVYLAHRLAFLYMTGRWPNEVDHKNGVKTDNRWCNLRDADRRLNSENTRAPLSTNSTGFLGVAPNGRKFRAQIVVNQKQICLGTFKTPARAHAEYVKAKRKLHEGCTI